MDDILQRNLTVLGERFPKVARLVEGASLPFDRRVEHTGAGVYVYQYFQDGGWRNLTSRYNPLREAEQQLSHADFEGAKFVFMVGEAGFYHVEVALSRLKPDARILFVSHRPDYLRVVFASRDLSTVLSDERLVFLVSEDMQVIQQGILFVVGRDQYDVPTFAHWAHPVEERLQSDFVTEIWSFLHYVFNAELVNLHTTRFFEHWWARNFVCNIPALLQAKHVQELEGTWRNRPVIVVGAGPSLNKNIELLRECRNRALIFCVDTAYRALERRGIEPHMVVTLDGSPMNAELMCGCNYDRYPLFIEPYSHYEIVRHHQGPKLVSCEAGAHEHWWNMVLPEQPRTASRLPIGGSVATAAFSMARFIGADPVICVGLDLSYPQGQCYAAGTLHDQRKVEDLRGNRELYEVEDIYGETVYTTHDYLFYLRWFEREVKAGDRTYVNATEGGALKHGWKVMTLREAMEQYASSDVPTAEWMDAIVSRRPDPSTIHTVHQNLKRSRRQLRAARRFLTAMMESLVSYSQGIESGHEPDPGGLSRLQEAQRRLRRLPLALAFLDAISFDTVYVDIKLSDAVAKDSSDTDERERQRMWANKSALLIHRLLELTNESINIHNEGIQIFEQEFHRELREARHVPAECV
ncbi:MAG: motility associated factor glycosyltransferase family protein [Alicyclobacillaceae bacterium]|nr:motility associated factor glycosyltransferase family protein [Alicyclobacillaceae bacterium]